MFNYAHTCTAGEPVDALVGLFQSQIEQRGDCLIAGLREGGTELHLTGQCPEQACEGTIRFELGEIHTTIVPVSNQARFTTPRGVSHILPSRFGANRIVTDIAMSFGTQADPQRHLHFVGGGWRQTLTEGDGRWVTDTSRVWNSLTHIKVADITGDGESNIVYSNGTIWGDYHTDQGNLRWFGLNNGLAFVDHRFTVQFALGDLDGAGNADVALLTHLGNPQNNVNNPYRDGPPDDLQATVFLALTSEQLNGANPRNTTGLRSVPLASPDGAADEHYTPTGVEIARLEPGGPLQVIITTDAADSGIAVASVLGDETQVVYGPSLGVPASQPTRLLWDANREVTAVVIPDGVLVVDEQFERLAHADVPGTIVSIAAGDLNGDGRDDLLVSNQYGSLYLLQRYGFGFSDPQLLAVDHLVGALRAFNEPGMPFDGALLYRDTLGFRLLRAADEPLGHLVVEFGLEDAESLRITHAVDLNGDGRAEILGTSEEGVLYAYDEQRGQIQLGLFPGYAVGDVDGDGRDDLVVSEQAGGVNRISVLHRALDPDLSAHDTVTINANHSATRIAIGDTNGDGRAEIIACGGDSVQLFTYSATVLGPFLWRWANYAPDSPCDAVSISNIEPGGYNEPSFISGRLLTTVVSNDDALVAESTDIGVHQTVEILPWSGTAGRLIPLVFVERPDGRRSLARYQLENGAHQQLWQIPLPASVTAGTTGDLRGQLKREIILAHHDEASREAYLSIIEPNADQNAWVELARSPAFEGRVNSIVVGDIDGDGTAEAVVQVIDGDQRQLATISWQAD